MVTTKRRSTKNPDQLLMRIGDPPSPKHGGGIVTRGKYGVKMVTWEPIGGGSAKFAVRTMDVPDDVFEEYYNWADPDDVASGGGRNISGEGLRLLGKSSRIEDRVYAMQATGLYYGEDNLDPYPKAETLAQVMKRWSRATAVKKARAPKRGMSGRLA